MYDEQCTCGSVSTGITSFLHLKMTWFKRLALHMHFTSTDCNLFNWEILNAS